MSEPTHPQDWPSTRGPWPEVENLSRTFDHGRVWCANAHGHPDVNDGYPNPDHHVPWHECHTLATAIRGARADLYGPPLELETYAAASFSYGQLRTDTPPSETRIVLEAYNDAPGADPGFTTRMSISIGDALHLARRLVQIVDAVTVPIGRR